METRAGNLMLRLAVVVATLSLTVGCQHGALRDSGGSAAASALGEVSLASYVQPTQQPALPSQSPIAGPHAMDFYVQYALANNPAIQAAVNDVEAARERIPQARSLDDPTLDSKGYPFFPNTPQTVSGRATAGLGLSQKYPWFGKLRLQGEIAREELHVAEAMLAATRLEVTEQTKRAYFEIYYVQHAITITEENRKVLEQLAKFADIRYQVKKDTSQQDVLRAEVELSNLDTELIRLRQERKSSQARLARLLHVSPETDLRADEPLSETEIPSALERLYEIAVQGRPELQAALHAVQRERNARELACKQYYPDATLGIDWTEMTTHKAIAPTADGIDDVGLSLSVNIPIRYNRLDAAVREAEARTSSASRRYDSQRDQTLESVKDIFAQVESQRDVIRLLSESILPKAIQTLQVSMADYQAARVDFLQLLNNFQEVLKVQLLLERQRSQLQQSLASLQRAVGGDLNRQSNP